MDGERMEGGSGTELRAAAGKLGLKLQCGPGDRGSGKFRAGVRLQGPGSPGGIPE